jgi:hypothetical protein
MTSPEIGRRIPIECLLPLQEMLGGRRGEGWIYGLTDPRLDHAIAYVGQTVNLLRRYLEHCDPDSPKRECRLIWVQELQAKGYVPGLMVIEEPERESLLTREAFWIKYCLGLGLAWLNKGLVIPDRVFVSASDQLREKVDEIQRVNQAQRDRRAAGTRHTQRVGAARRLCRAILDERSRQVRIESDRQEAARRARAAERQAAKHTEAEFDRRVMVEAQKLAGRVIQQDRNAKTSGVLPFGLIR